MKKGSTLFLRGILVIMGLIALALCIFAVVPISKGLILEFPVLIGAKYLIMAGLYASSIPFFVALYQTFKLLNYIDKNIAFSDLSVKALKNIQYCGIAMWVIFSAGMTVGYAIAEYDDAPGVILVFFLIALAPLVIAVFAAVLKRLLQNAIDMKSENDLTV